MLSNGQGVERDRAAALPWYEKSSRKGHRAAWYNLGLYFAKGFGGVHINHRRAEICFEKAAKKGFIPAMTSLAVLYRAAAASYQQHVSLSENNNSNNDVRLLRQQMNAQQEKRERMVYWYQKAATLGDAAAQRELGMLYDSGLGVTQNYEQAFILLQKAAAQNDPRATLLLGSYYQNGLGGIEPNTEKALELYNQAVQLGATT